MKPSDAKAYNPKNIEPKWQQVWSDTKLYRAVTGDISRPKYYMLTEFPYPSGDGLHAGHAREYTLGDVIARHKRMQGYNVLYPMGFDAFGLPTENYAIKHKIRPQDATSTNVANFRRQFDALGYSFDWDRMVNTTDPNYYRWTQWLFLKFLEAGLAYQAEMAINWCPKEKTGLANEEVVDGKHERCGTPVEKKLLKQWMFGITQYADRLIEGLKSVDYPSRIAEQQINWIGRSEGAEIDFDINGEKVTVYTTRPDTLAGTTFLVLAPEHAAVGRLTTPDRKAAVDAYIKKAGGESEVERQNTDREKTGVFTGAYAKNPLTGEQMPVWIADYVLGGYGTGAIMAVPAHDERDFAFAQAFSLPVKQVIAEYTELDGDTAPRVDWPTRQKQVVDAIITDGKGNYLLQCEDIDGQEDIHFVGGGVDEGDESNESALRREILEEVGYPDIESIRQVSLFVAVHGQRTLKKRNHKTWGAFYEVIVDPSNQIKSEIDKGLHRVIWVKKWEVAERISWPHHAAGWRDYLGGRVLNKEVRDGLLVNSGEFDGLHTSEAKEKIVQKLEREGIGRSSIKFKLRDWIFSRQHYWGEPIPVIHCPKDGVVPVPENQLPVTLPDVEHYEPNETGESPLAAIIDWVNVDCPKCGGPAQRETDTMPNWAGSSWYYLRYMDARNDQAFASPEALNYWKEVDLYLGGMEHTTLHLLYSRFWHQFLYDLKLVPTAEPYAARRGQGIVLAADGRKMSKSIGNVVNPTDIIATHGADTLRLYILFMAPYDESTAWSEDRLNGASRFIYRVWTFFQEVLLPAGTESAVEGPDDDCTNPGIFELEVDKFTHKTIQKIHNELHEMRFNTVISTLMEYVNFLTKAENKHRLTQAHHDALRLRTAKTLALLLAPVTPHIAEELWHDLGETESVHISAWPKYDPELIKDDFVTIAVQVNGKVRASILAEAGATEDELKDTAAAEPKVAAYLAEGTLVKTIVIPRKVVNFVVRL
ncbi:MAG: hypothetical protein NVSMB39_5560 [Candidatus Saccharimonadales bacterium]